MATALWSAEHLNLAIGRQIIFKDAEFSIAENERVALIGRNGTGKSTLLRIVAGTELPSSGSIAPRRGMYVAVMPQEFERGEGRNCGEVLREGVHRFDEMLRKYDQAPTGSEEHARLEHYLSLHDAWNPESQLPVLRDQLDLPDDSRCFDELSGGEQRRVLLARAIASAPDLLLLDEPTNHLDVESIGKIERFLAGYNGACLFVTHDRYFLDRVATRIVELEHGAFFSCSGSYTDFLEAKEAAVYAADSEAARRSKFLRREIEWVRRSPKARLRRNLGRVRRFEELSAVAGPERDPEMELLIPPPARLGNKVVNFKNVSKALGGKKLIDGFDYEFTPGCKVGIVGPNGCGKTTLLKLLTGKIEPDTGSVETAETVKFNYVEQNRVRLDPEKTVFEEIAGDADFLHFGGERVSVRTYLKRFLFEDERINSKILYLSGGERARLAIARMLKDGGNFLILDEPTNDLDLSSLRVLEEALFYYPSSLVVVSHDRYFLNRVCEAVIGFDPETGKILCVPGDYDYYLVKKMERNGGAEESAPAPRRAAEPEAPKTPKNRKALSYREEKELEGMEEAIAAAEGEVVKLETLFSAPDFFTRHGAELAKLNAELDGSRRKVETLYVRWEELEKKRSAGVV